MSQIVLDTECYANYWLLMMKIVGTDQVRAYELYDGHEPDWESLQKVLTNGNNEIITFNGVGYDMPMIAHALGGGSTASLKAASDDLIVNDVKHWQLNRRYQSVKLTINHVDVMEIAAGQCGLKTYGGRLNTRKMQDLPINPDDLITSADRERLKEYCRNDLQVTEELFTFLKPQIDLRREMSKQYRIDLRSKSDAQIAEAILKSEVSNMTGRQINKPIIVQKTFYYDAPEYIRRGYADSTLGDVLKLVESSPFIVKDNGVTVMAEALAELKINMGKSVYQMGMGGLHSTEQEVSTIATDDYMIADFDVNSYYPSLIINNKLVPPNMGEAFLDVYSSIKERRLIAKREKNMVMSDVYKIVLNGSFGKLGSAYSTLYAPEMMVQTTLTGQLSLLLLIEWMEKAGISVISANTDGIVMKCHKALEQVMLDTVAKWEKLSGLEMERTDYSAVYSRDVNSYIAIKTDGKVKGKGAFAYASLAKNPQNEVCIDAVVAFLKNGTPIIHTLEACRDIRRFISIRAVKGGATKDGKYLGKVVRSYYKVGERGTINYISNGNIVPRSRGAVPCMELPDEFPNDLDMKWYEKECTSLLMDLGAITRPVVEKLPRKNSKVWKTLLLEGKIYEYETGKYTWVEV